MQPGPLQDKTFSPQNIVIDDLFTMLSNKLEIRDIARLQQVCRFFYDKFVTMGSKAILTNLKLLTEINLNAPIDKPKNYYWQQVKKFTNLKKIQIRTLNRLKIANSDSKKINYLSELSFSKLSDFEQNKSLLTQNNDFIFYMNTSGLLNLIDVSKKGLYQWPDNPQQIDDTAAQFFKRNQVDIPPVRMVNIWQGITEINIKNNFIVELPESFIFPNLQELKLDDNELSELPKSFTRMTSLTLLSLYGNKFKSLPDDFKLLTNLNHLILGKNGLTIIPDCIQYLNLQELELDNNGLSELPKNFSQMTSLTSLSLYDNKFKSLPDDFKLLTNLDDLTLGKNKFAKTPNCIQYFNLTGLYLSELQLTKIPKWISKLTDLDSLYLHDNCLTKLPLAMSMLTKLHELTLSDNQLTCVPECLQYWTNLEELSLDGNQLNKLPPTFTNLTNLYHLSLSNNLFSDFPNEINSLVNLRRLYLRNNYITEIPLTTNLHQLNRYSFALDHNLLSTVPERSLRQFGMEWFNATINAQFPMETLKAYCQEIKQYLDKNQLDVNLTDTLVDNLAPYFHPHENLFFSTCKSSFAQQTIPDVQHEMVHSVKSRVLMTMDLSQI